MLKKNLLLPLAALGILLFLLLPAGGCGNQRPPEKQAEAGVAVAESALASAGSVYAVAEANYQRGKQLLEQGAIPQAVFEAEYELKYKQAKEQAEHALPAQVAQARANLALAQSAYNDSLIKATFSGQVTARNANPGEMASSAVPVISLVNLDKVVVKTYVPESLINQLKQKQKIKVSAVSERPLTGTIASLAPAADPANGSFAVKIQIENPRHILKPGMFASAEFIPSLKESLLVPREAVVKDANKDIVWTVKEGRAKKKEVKTGESDGKMIVIASGLAEGEEVVIAGQENLEENTRVNVRNREEK